MRVAFVSFRLGGTDGVSIESAKWQAAFAGLGWEVITVAGSGHADHRISGLSLSADDLGGPDRDALRSALAPADVVIVDNLLSIPLNPAAADAVGGVLRGRPAILRHHDLPWQHLAWDRPGWTVPHDVQWRHITLSELSRTQLLDRTGISARVMRNRFDVSEFGERAATRADLGIAEDETLLLQPTRALTRKNLPASLALAEAIGATWWLTGPAEQGFDDELSQLKARARVKVVHQPRPRMADAYAACDAVAFPSDWEGFGNPPLEAAIARRPVAVGSFPVAIELIEEFGFRWHDPGDPNGLMAFLEAPDPTLLEHNRGIVERHFSLDDLGAELAQLLQGWNG